MEIKETRSYVQWDLSYGLYAVMYSLKFGLYSLPGGSVEGNEAVLTALHREIMEETGCSCDQAEELAWFMKTGQALTIRR